MSIGLDGGPTLRPDGIAGWRTTYDRRGEPIEYVYLGIDRNPSLRRWSSASGSGGYARRTLSYDARGRILEHAYYGLSGERVRGPDGWARVVHGYDLRGSEPVQTAYFDEADRPAILRRGFHATRQRFDQYGRMIEVTFHGPDMAPIKTIEGYARLTIGYDGHGRRTEDAIFGADGQPVASADGLHKSSFRYDERGQRIEARHFGTKDEPIRLAGMYQHSTRYTHDERGKLVEIVHFDTRGNPSLGPDINNRELCARWTGKYDADGKLVGQSCDKDLQGGQKSKPPAPTKTTP
jgi:YD repeat-containing protein